MDRLAKLVSGAYLVLAAFSANAGYAQLAPPAGWSAGTGAATGGGQFAFGQAANSATLANGTVRTTASLNVAGRAVSIPASMRFAANAPRIAAEVLFSSPHLRVLIGLGTMLAAVKYGWDANTQSWREINSSTGAIDTYWANPQYPSERRGSPGEVCKFMHGSAAHITVVMIDQDSAACVNSNTGARMSISYRYKNGTPSCPAGWTQTPAGCLGPAIQRPQFIDEVGGSPMPNSVPSEIPSTPLPVDIPQISPTFVPTGNPVRNPNYDPNAEPSPNNQPYLQPGVRVTPAPAPGNPWQVDVQPVNRPQPTNSPNPDPQSDPVENPGDNPAPENQPDLCEKYPDILACQKLDLPEDNTLKEIEKPIAITPDSGWGAQNAACPPPKILMVQGRKIAIPFDLFCTYMQGMRPIIIAMAWLSAAFILVGARENS